ncbi:50S ribosomal protein L22 [Candidatus Woesearchaeota archaeon]|nr:50S ribosomal protein L22 [Candidatus Woesearchaeota archaeon]
MTTYKYAWNGTAESVAKCVGLDLPISTKAAVHLCSFLRGKDMQEAKKLLEGVIQKTSAVPYKRYNDNVGHRKGIGPGRYPVKASEIFKNLLQSVEANAQSKGLNTNQLTIVHICAHNAPLRWHFGRWRRRRMKRTHVEIVVQEKPEVKAAQKQKKTAGQKEPRRVKKVKVQEPQPKPSSAPKEAEKND